MRATQNPKQQHRRRAISGTPAAMAIPWVTVTPTSAFQAMQGERGRKGTPRARARATARRHGVRGRYQGRPAGRQAGASRRVSRTKITKKNITLMWHQKVRPNTSNFTSALNKCTHTQHSKDSRQRAHTVGESFEATALRDSRRERGCGSRGRGGRRSRCRCRRGSRRGLLKRCKGGRRGVVQRKVRFFVCREGQ